MSSFHPENLVPDNFWPFQRQDMPNREQYILDAEKEISRPGRGNRTLRAAFRRYEAGCPDPRQEAKLEHDSFSEPEIMTSGSESDGLFSRAKYLGHFNKRTRRLTAAVLAGAVGVAAFTMWRNHQEDVRVENAKRYVATQEALQFPEIMRGLGLCTTELNAEAAVSKDKEQRHVRVGRPSSAEYLAAAELANDEHISCAPQVSAWQFNQGDLDTKLKSSDVTEFNVPTICTDLGKFEEGYYRNDSSLRAKLAIGIIADQAINC